MVLSLREDFLGLLEEASDRVPQILDNRFRLAPLDRDTAALAITGPAQIDDATFATRPFRFDPDVVPAILDYLTKTATAGRRSSSCYVEPFHLQLICQRIERTVAEKQKSSSAPVQFSLQDLGGEESLAKTLAGFYEEAIQSLHGMMLRRAARRMICEEFLISPEGRRLSVDERELQAQLKLPPDTLRQLVDRRLLRTDRRADATYYELSHDALVQPVLNSRRTQALCLLAGWEALWVHWSCCLPQFCAASACTSVCMTLMMRVTKLLRSLFLSPRLPSAILAGSGFPMEGGPAAVIAATIRLKSHAQFPQRKSEGGVRAVSSGVFLCLL